MSNQKVTIPTFFHELLGKKQYKIDVFLVFGFAIISMAFLGFITYAEWESYKWYQLLLLGLLYIDIAGGAIANLTEGTDLYYSNEPKKRLVFLAIHIQPLLLGAVLPTSMPLALAVWVYTISSALVTNHLNSTKYQRTVGGLLCVVGLISLYIIGSSLDQSIFIIYLLYIIKVVFSFSVVHHSKEKL